MAEAQLEDGARQSRQLGDTYFAFELDLFFVVVWCVPFRKAGFAPVSGLSLVSLHGGWSRSAHCRFWIKMNESTILKRMLYSKVPR